MSPTESEIRQRSYFIWESDGCPEGRAWDNWFRAEAELRLEDSHRPDLKSGGRRTPPAKPPSRGKTASPGTTRKRSSSAKR